MKNLVLLIIAAMLMMVTAPAYSDSVVQVFHCQQGNDTTDEQVEEMAEEWLKAAKGVKGGANLELSLYFPIAGQEGDSDLSMILTAPSFAEWGAFTDAYDGSAADKVDEKHQDSMTCSESALWEQFKVE